VSAEARLAATELAARAEVAAALARESAARQAFAVYSGGVRGLARQNLDVVRQTFDLGRATVFDVLAEQRRFLEVEQGYIASARELWDARVELTRAMGETQ
ncbi:MAG: TolC family protein, partial [Gemmatimonadaceae bacterium]|nr:TolC family protein [Gemmatimonadaceae bacterium]